MKRIARVRRAVAARLRSEEGFSLSELLVTITISSFIVGAIAAAFLVSSHTSLSANIRLRESHDAQMLNTWFGADARNAAVFATSSGMSGCTVNPGEVTVVRFGWTDGAAARRVFYVRPSATSPELIRRYCASATSGATDQILVRNLAGITVSCTPSCSGVPSLITLTVTELSGYEYTVQASPRMTTVAASLNPYPTLLSAKRAGTGEWTNGSTVEWTVRFSESVTGVDAGDFRIDRIVGNTPTLNVAPVAVFGVAGSNTYTVRAGTGSVDGDLLINVVDNDTIADYDGLRLGGSGVANGNFAGEKWKFDKTAPVVADISRSGSVQYSSTGPLGWTVKFSEPVSNVQGSNFAFARSGITGTPTVVSVSASGAVPTTDWIVRADTTGVTGANSGRINLNLSSGGTIQDQAGNVLGGTFVGGAGAEYGYDTTRPVPTASKAPTQFDPANTNPIMFTVTFDEPVDGFTNSDVNVTGTAPGPKTVVVTPATGPATSYTVTVAGASAAGTVGIEVPADAAVDRAGNPSTGPVSAQVTYDPNAVTTPVFAVVDSGSGRLVRFYQGSGAPWSTASWSLHSDDGDPSGTAMIGSKVYILDSADLRVYRYSLTGTLEATSKRLRNTGNTSPGGTMTGLAIDGDDVWVAQDGGRILFWDQDSHLFRYSLADLFGSGDIRALASTTLRSENGDPSGLAIDSGWLYVTDSSDGIVYRYSRSGSGSDVSRRLYDRQGTSNSDLVDTPQGASIVGGLLWVVDDADSSSRAHGYDLVNLFSGTGNINSTADFGIGGSEPRGI